MPFLAVGGSDCERLGAGLLAQPTNAVSSAVFLIAGIWMVARSGRAAGRRAELAVYGAAVASNALGGLLLHGLQTPATKWVHDVCILSVVVFIVAFDLARLSGRTTQWTMRVFGAVLASLGLVLAFARNVTFGLFAALGLAIVGLELGEYRRELPRIRAEGLTARPVARLAALAALALGTTAYLVGRSEGSLCRPGSAFQWHAVWHVLAALTMALYSYAAIEPHPVGA
jgi:hypothetical protein